MKKPVRVGNIKAFRSRCKALRLLVVVVVVVGIVIKRAEFTARAVPLPIVVVAASTFKEETLIIIIIIIFMATIIIVDLEFFPLQVPSRCRPCLLRRCTFLK